MYSLPDRQLRNVSPTGPRSATNSLPDRPHATGWTALTANTRFTVDKSTLNVAAYEQHGGKRGQLRFSTVDLAGELVVTDAERFATTLASGIGRAKAFGFSLLLVRPLD